MAHCRRRLPAGARGGGGGRNGVTVRTAAAATAVKAPARRLAAATAAAAVPVAAIAGGGAGGGGDARRRRKRKKKNESPTDDEGGGIGERGRHRTAPAPAASHGRPRRRAPTAAVERQSPRDSLDRAPPPPGEHPPHQGPRECTRPPARRPWPPRRSGSSASRMQSTGAPPVVPVPHESRAGATPCNLRRGRRRRGRAAAARRRHAPPGPPRGPPSARRPRLCRTRWSHPSRPSLSGRRSVGAARPGLFRWPWRLCPRRRRDRPTPPTSQPAARVPSRARARTQLPSD